MVNRKPTKRELLLIDVIKARWQATYDATLPEWRWLPQLAMYWDLAEVTSGR